jgi:two-component system, sensor histidine kinase and response regulator
MAEEEALEISRGDLHKVADFLPYPFIIAEISDGVHHNTFLNEKFIEEISYALEEIPTIEKWYECAYPDDAYRRQVIDNWQREESNSRREGKIFVKMKSQVTCKNGCKRWYEIKATVIKNIHVVAFVDLDKEITLQEELKNINRNNDRMLSLLGHDLRTPIANLMSISSLAATTAITNEEFVEVIEMINTQSTQVLELLDNTMNWAKVNFNAISITTETIDINSLISNILSIYKNALDSKNLTVKRDTSTMRTVCSDAEILTIIIRNLLSNAIKFTPENGTITIESHADGLTVSDTGIGMPQAIIDALTAHNYSSRKGTNNEVGTGLGLQLVVTLAEKINCTLMIESEEFKGTTMKIVGLNMDC